MAVSRRPRKLRPYQSQAVKAWHRDVGNGKTRSAVVLPTGTGKTDVGSGVIVPWAQAGGPGSVLVMAHRDELLNQVTERIAQHDPALSVGRWQGTRKDAKRHITVASIQTLWQAGGIERFLDLNGRPAMGMVDECHHAVSPSYLSVLRELGAMHGHHPTPLLGLTATMVRGDRIGLGDVWQSVAFQRDIAWAIREGFLVVPRGQVIVVNALHLDEAKVSGGDYQEGELGSMIEQGADEIVDAWVKHAEGRITASFAPTVEAAHAIADEFNARDIPAAVVTGDTPKDERARIYAALAAGELKVLSGVMVTTEGWDCPPVSCILQCRPTRLPGLYQQIVGRGLRTLDPEVYPGHPEKTDCLVLDCVGASRHQKLTTLVDLYESAEIDSTELEDVFDEDEIDPDDEGAGGLDLPEPPRLIGPREYEDIDLFKDSGYVWLFTYGGTRFLPAGDRIAVMWQHPKTGKLRVGHCLAKPRYDRSTRQYDRDGVWLRDGWGSLDGWDIDTGRLALEAWVDNYAGTLARKGASWRKGKNTPPTDAQIMMATRLGIDEPHLYTKSALSDEISIAFASQMLD
jgi:superfamily II DNA or RNA helicase